LEYNPGGDQWTIPASGGQIVETALMAKKKVKAEGKEAEPPAKPKAEESRVRTGVLLVRGVPEWKVWAEELADFDRAPSMNDLVDRALVVYARHVGFPKPAPKR
jgi:hypothetical protein